MLLQDHDRVNDLAQRDLLAETSRAPIGEFGANTFSSRIPNPVAKVMNDLRQSRLEIGGLHRPEPVRPLVGRQVASDVLYKPIRVEFDEFNEFCTIS